MPNFKKYTKTSDFLRAVDLEDGPLSVTIKKWAEEEVTGQGGRKTKELVLHFEEPVKKFIPSNGTAEQISVVAKSEDLDDWPGAKINLFLERGFVMPNGSKVDVIRASAQSSSVEFDSTKLDKLIAWIEEDEESRIPQVIKKVLSKEYSFSPMQAEEIKSKFPTLKF